jgi:hypothetical protein
MLADLTREQAAHRRLIRHWLAAKVDVNKTPHRLRIVERFFGCRVRQIVE